MTPNERRRYRPAPGVDVVRLPAGDVLLRSDTAAVRVQGRAAGLLADRVLPLLDGSRTLADVAAALGDVAPEALRPSLDRLVEAGVLRRDDQAGEAAAGPGPLEPFLAFLEEIGVGRDEAAARLAAASVTVFGLEAHGAHLAAMLATTGIGRVVLVDPFPLEPGNLALMPPMAGGAAAARAGGSREEALREALVPVAGGEVLTSEAVRGAAGALNRDAVGRLAAGSGLLAGCFDRGFAAANVWINEASIAAGIPAVFAELRTHVARIGPLVVPGSGACYLCWRMRSIACEDDAEQALALEEHLDRARRPALAGRPVLPFLAPHVAGLLAVEAMKILVGSLAPSLAGVVHEFDALTFETRRHRVLSRPGCPACRGPAAGDRGSGGHGTDPPDLRRELVSPLCGLVRDLRPVPLDVGEPPGFHLAAATLANHAFAASPPAEVAAGKGFTPAEAEAGALGEAVERYAASRPPDGPVTVCRRDRLDGPSLDPFDLVLYAEHQYDTLPFTRYDPATRLGWVRGRSATGVEEVWVPAIAASMGYVPHGRDEWLFAPNSSGTATGRTLEQAVVEAALEVLERDAFVVAWLNRLPGTRVDPDGHPDPAVRGLVRSFQRRLVSIELYRLPTDGPAHVFLALAVQGRDPRAGRMPGLEAAGPAMAIGLGADLGPGAAARRAILEAAQVRSSLTGVLSTAAGRRRLAELEDDPRRTASPEDHGLLYAGARMRDRFDFLRSGPAGSIEWDPDPDPAPAAERLELLAGHLRSRRLDLIHVDLTPPDVAGLGLHVVRALIPGHQPLHFGWGQARLGGTRLYDLPVELGLLEGPHGAGELNDDPHPLP